MAIDRSSQTWPESEVYDICPLCQQPMLDGQLVATDWSGVAFNHVNCEQYQTPELVNARDNGESEMEYLIRTR
jgi:hypothetical protein